MIWAVCRCWGFVVIIPLKPSNIPVSSLFSEATQLRRTAEALKITEDPGLLKETVVLKLNGGLGTGMGLDKAWRGCGAGVGNWPGEEGSVARPGWGRAWKGGVRDALKKRC